jgi:serine/threonine-protein kinase
MLGNQPMDSLIGRSFKGYRVIRFIARGGMGLVFEANQESLDRPVVIKFLYPHLSSDSRFRERFEREARSIARLNHPNIVRVLDFGSEDMLHFMILEYVDGVSLRERLVRIHNEGLTLRSDTVAYIMQQVGAGLTYAHDQGFVHRDVKPGNILLGNTGRVYLTDFGVVKLVGQDQGTVTGTMIGTPEYMAPEQATSGIIGPAADQYSLAIVAYEMLVGRVPFQAPTPVAVLHKHLNEVPPPPSMTVTWFPPVIDAIFNRALAKHPDDRYPTVTAFTGDLVQALNTNQMMVGPGAPTMFSDPSTLSRPGTPPPTASGLGGTPPPYSTSPTGATPAGASYPSATTGAGAGRVPVPYVVNQPGTPPPAYGVPPAGGTPPPSAVSQPVSDATPPEKRRGTIIAGAALVILLLGALGGYLLFSGGGDDGNGGTGSGAGADATATAQALVAASETAEAQAATTATPAGETATPEAAATETSAPAGETPTEEPAAPTATPTPETAILFASHRGGVHDSQIYVMNPDGSDQRQLTFTRGHSWGPRPALDGQTFFFSSVAPGEHTSHDASGGGTTGQGNHDIYVGTLEGTSATDLAAAGITNITAGLTSWDNGWSWSPDGQWITFTSNRTTDWNIFIMDAEGRNVNQLTTDPAQDGWPVWTPDGKRIIFSSDRSGNWEIYSMARDGSDVRPLTDDPATVDIFPEVSPDGTRIVFSKQVEAVNEGEIYVMDIDGQNPTRLTSTAALNNMPSWCPGGDRIVFVSDRDGNNDVYIMNADGTGVMDLTDDPGEDTTPSCFWIGDD